LDRRSGTCADLPGAGQDPLQGSTAPATVDIQSIAGGAPEDSALVTSINRSAILLPVRQLSSIDGPQCLGGELSNRESGYVTSTLIFGCCFQRCSVQVSICGEAGWRPVSVRSLAWLVGFGAGQWIVNRWVGPSPAWRLHLGASVPGWPGHCVWHGSEPSAPKKQSPRRR